MNVLSMYFPFQARELAKADRAASFFAGKCDSPNLTENENSLTDDEFETYYAMIEEETAFTAEEFSALASQPKDKVSIEQVLGL